MRVLVAEDSSSERLIVTALLTRRGYQVVEAADGMEAWEKLQQHDVQLVISDWNMPRMNGLELCRRIRDAADERYTYVILLTMRSSKQSMVEGMEAGADDFMVKPVDVAELEVRLRAGDRVIKLQRALEDHNRQLTEAVTTMRADLESAAAVQKELLPRPATLQGTEFRWFFQPSSYLAGDVIGYFPLDERHLGLFQIDVSGHGIRSALLSFTLNNVLSTPTIGASIVKRGLEGPPHYELVPPAEVAAELNRRFVEHQRTSLYFTMVYAILDTRNGELVFTQAGHPPPIWLRRDRGTATPLGQGGFPVALLKQATFDQNQARLEVGDRLYLCSDGVLDCPNPQGEPFAEERLLQLFEDTASLPTSAVAEELRKVLHGWSQSSEFDDDISVLIMERGEK
jgi:sigma-B regulation protein RsbU (phosphoserine phosphatase)